MVEWETRKGVEMRKKAFLCLFTGILMFHAQGIFPQQAQDLAWEIQLQTEGRGAAMPDSQTITVETGRDFCISITPDSDSFCYVLSQNSGRKFFVLYDQGVRGGNEIILEPLLADNSPGRKTLYVIISVERQTRLENSINTYKSNPNSNRHAGNLQGEIAGLQDRVSSLGEPASVIISTGGSTRGSTPVAADYATRFSGRNMYVKAITIHAAPANS
jgi:hypothetical protein